jgi:hypothetical protein
MKINFLIFLLLLGSCTPLAQNSSNYGTNTKVLRNIDYQYEETIKSVVIRPNADEPESYLLPAVTQLGNWNLVLEFDDLNTQRENYYARIIHCNRDWTTSNLQDLDYLTQFNEFPITNFEFSVDTHIPYTRYWLNLPPVKLPGNYVVVVYRESNKDDILLSKRFMVFDNRVSFKNERNLIGAGSIAALNQQINFTINYKNLEVINPLESINVTIRQNQRWDNIAHTIKPSFVRELDKELEYRFFDDKVMFKGGNEFRFFDLRSLNSPGRNVASVNKAVKPFEVYIATDKPRINEVYGQYLDYNGNFIIDNLDFRDDNFNNYSNINFTLSSKPLRGEVYVTGEFNYWNLDEKNLMRYDSTRQEYHARILLKQGWYDYQYLIKSKELSPYYLEGSHYETENTYEIFVYYSAFQPRADLLIGYIRLDKNQR